MTRNRFRPDELAGSAGAPDGGERPADAAGLLATARELEWLAASDEVGPSGGFEDRVMAAIALEPAPRPLAAAAVAARRGRPAAILAALGDVWRVAWSGGRPLAVRAPAMAVVALMFVGAVGLGGLGAAAAFGLLGPQDAPTPTPGPVFSPSPSVIPTPGPSSSPAIAPSASPEPTASPSPSPTASPSESPAQAETPEPAETERPDGLVPEPTIPAKPTASPDSSGTPEPTRTPRPTESPEP